MTLMLHRFWIEFAPEDGVRLGLGLGCGVTAFDLEDAMALVTDVLGQAPPDPVNVTHDVDTHPTSAASGFRYSAHSARRVRAVCSRLVDHDGGRAGVVTTHRM